jgi:hypothetical protein
VRSQRKTKRVFQDISPKLGKETTFQTLEERTLERLEVKRRGHHIPNP